VDIELRWIENWLTWWAQRAVTSSTEAIKWPLISCVCQESLLSPVLCKSCAFINDLADGTKCTFSQFAENENFEKLLIDHMVVLPFRRTSASCRNGPTGISWSSTKGHAKSSTSGGTTWCPSTDWGLTSWKAGLQKRI